MLVQIDQQLQQRIAGVTFGCAIIKGVTVRERDERLWHQVERLSERLSHEYQLEKLGDYERIVAVRGLQKTFGFDPTRYRPSSEALLRRVLKRLGVYQINTAVDVNNWCSLEFLLPICIYDLRHIAGQMRVRSGGLGESYPGIGRQTFVIEQKVIIADDEGVVGNTVSDSERTKVTLATTDLALIIYAPPGSIAQRVPHFVEVAVERMLHYNGGELVEMQTITV